METILKMDAEEAAAKPRQPRTPPKVHKYSAAPATGRTPGQSNRNRRQSIQLLNAASREAFLWHDVMCNTCRATAASHGF